MDYWISQIEYLGKGLESPPGFTPIAINLGGLAKDEKEEASCRV